MTSWIRLTAPAAVVASMASPAGAVQYLSIAQAQKQAFPSATSFAAIDGRAWKAQAGSQVLGVFVVDHVIRNISGATLSSNHVTEGVKRVLATYGSRAR